MKIYVLAPTLLFADYTCFVLCDMPILWSSLCYYLLCLYTGAPWLHISIYKTGVSLFCWIIGLPMIISWLTFLPISITLYLARTWIKPTFAVPLAAVIASFVTLNLAQAFWFGHSHALSSYTLWQFCANIIVILLMSLTIHGVGEQGNRL